MADLAEAYADVNERDHKSHVAAIEAAKISAPAGLTLARSSRRKRRAIAKRDLRHSRSGCRQAYVAAAASAGSGGGWPPAAAAAAGGDPDAPSSIPIPSSQARMLR